MEIPTNPVPLEDTVLRAVRIIEPGNLPDKVVYRATCQRCGCVFEFDDDPLKLWSMTGPGRWCPTPGCNKYVTGVRA